MLCRRCLAHLYIRHEKILIELKIKSSERIQYLLGYYTLLLNYRKFLLLVFFLQLKLFLYTRNRRTSHLFEINTLREIIIILGKLPYLIVQVLIMNSCLVYSNLNLIILMDIFLVYRQLSTLPKCFLATIDTAYEWFFTSMRILVFFEVLREYEGLFTMFAYVLFLIDMFQHVSLEGKFARKKFLAVLQVALVELLPHF